MIDIQKIRDNPQEIKKALARKGFDSKKIDLILMMDEIYRENLHSIEKFKAEQNEASKKIPTLKGEEKKKLLLKLKKIAAAKKSAEITMNDARDKIEEFASSIPNPPADDAPDGQSDKDNVVVRQEGTLPQFSFTPKTHDLLAEKLDILDTQASAKVSGSRFYYLKNELAILQRALIFWAFTEVQKKGFIPMIPPFLTKKEAIHGTGYLAHDENYIVNPGEDDLYLIGTSEVPMVSYHAGETLDLSQGPLRYVSYSPCFRREAGSYGKDSKGIFRVHQFEKVEMVVFCAKEEAESCHAEILRIEEDLLQKLEIPYQVVNVCCGDLGISATRKYDLEGWLAGQGKYRELTSTSICTDFQSRRLRIKYKNKEGKAEYVYTLNGTAVASRPLIAILENNQQKDGSILIPKALQPLCGFKKIEVKK